MSNEGRGLCRVVNNKITVKKVQRQNSFFTENFDGVTAPALPILSQAEREPERRRGLVALAFVRKDLSG
jgi:hypothetical protein